MTTRANTYAVTVCAWGTTAAVAAASPALANGELAILTDTVSGSTVQLAVGVPGVGVCTVGGGFASPMTTLGDIIYENATPAAARLAGNTSTTQKLLAQTGSGSSSAAPSWVTFASAATGYSGGTAIVTLGTITTGTWQGAAVQWAYIGAISGLAAAIPALADTFPEYNVSAAGNRGVTIAQTGGILQPGIHNARLSLTTGVPVTTSDVTGGSAQTIWMTAFLGNRYTTYTTGSGWQEYALTSDLLLPLQQAVNCTYSASSVHVTLTSGNTSQMVPGMSPSGTMQTDFTGATILKITGATTFDMTGPSGGTPRTALASTMSFAASTAYDVFVVDNGGSPMLVPSNGWSNSTTRTDALGLQDGVNVNANAVVMGSGGITSIAAKQGKYVGTFYTIGSGTTEDSAANRFLWNRFNRKPKTLIQFDATASWNYTTAAFRQTNGNSANKVQVVVGIAEDAAQLGILGVSDQVSGSPTTNPMIGIGVSQSGTTTTNSAQTSNFASNSTLAAFPATATWDGWPAAGYTCFTMLEYGNGGGSLLWYGNDGGVPPFQTGMRGVFWC